MAAQVEDDCVERQVAGMVLEMGAIGAGAAAVEIHESLMPLVGH